MLARLLRRLEQPATAPEPPPALLDRRSELEALLEREGFLDGYGVRPESVTRAFHLKDESAGEPERAETFTRARLDMKDYELLFALRQLRERVRPGARVVDVASGSSLLPLIYTALGYDGVHQDVHPMAFAENVTQVVCEVADLDKHLEPETVDAATLICALEHFGLGRYGDALDGHGDFRGAESIRRILKPGGLLVATVPFGPPAIVFNVHRIYNYERLRAVLAGFELVEENYRFRPDWHLGTRAQAEQIELVLGGKRPANNFALALWALVKR